MLLKEGDKLFVAHRRLFDKDPARFFVGRVDAYETGVVKITGHSYVRDRVTGRTVEKAEVRTKILSLSSGTLLVYLLPEQTALDTIEFVLTGHRLTVTDGKEFRMNLMEFLWGGRGEGPVTGSEEEPA